MHFNLLLSILMRSAGVSDCPHSGQTIFRDARTFCKSIFPRGIRTNVACSLFVRLKFQGKFSVPYAGRKKIKLGTVSWASRLVTRGRRTRILGTWCQSLSVPGAMMTLMDDECNRELRQLGEIADFYVVTAVRGLVASAKSMHTR